MSRCWVLRCPSALLPHQLQECRAAGNNFLRNTKPIICSPPLLLVRLQSLLVVPLLRHCGELSFDGPAKAAAIRRGERRRR